MDQMEQDEEEAQLSQSQSKSRAQIEDMEYESEEEEEDQEDQDSGNDSEVEDEEPVPTLQDPNQPSSSAQGNGGDSTRVWGSHWEQALRYATQSTSEIGLISSKPKTSASSEQILTVAELPSSVMHTSHPHQKTYIRFATMNPTPSLMTLRQQGRTTDNPLAASTICGHILQAMGEGFEAKFPLSEAMKKTVRDEILVKPGAWMWVKHQDALVSLGFKASDFVDKDGNRLEDVGPSSSTTTITSSAAVAATTSAPAKEEAAPKKAAAKAAVKKEAPVKKAAAPKKTKAAATKKPAAPKKTAIKKETVPKKVAVKKEAAKKETAKKETVKKEPAPKKTTVKKEPVKKEALKATQPRGRGRPRKSA